MKISFYIAIYCIASTANGYSQDIFGSLHDPGLLKYEKIPALGGANRDADDETFRTPSRRMRWKREVPDDNFFYDPEDDEDSHKDREIDDDGDIVNAERSFNGPFVPWHLGALDPYKKTMEGEDMFEFLKFEFKKDVEPMGEPIWMTQGPGAAETETDDSMSLAEYGTIAYQATAAACRPLATLAATVTADNLKATLSKTNLLSSTLQRAFFSEMKNIMREATIEYLENEVIPQLNQGQGQIEVDDIIKNSEAMRHKYVMITPPNGQPFDRRNGRRFFPIIVVVSWYVVRKTAVKVIKKAAKEVIKEIAGETASSVADGILSVVGFPRRGMNFQIDNYRRSLDTINNEYVNELRELGFINDKMPENVVDAILDIYGHAREEATDVGYRSINLITESIVQAVVLDNLEDTTVTEVSNAIQKGLQAVGSAWDETTSVTINLIQNAKDHLTGPIAVAAKTITVYAAREILKLLTKEKVTNEMQQVVQEVMQTENLRRKKGSSFLYERTKDDATLAKSWLVVTYKNFVLDAAQSVADRLSSSLGDVFNKIKEFISQSMLNIFYSTGEKSIPGEIFLKKMIKIVVELATKMYNDQFEDNVDNVITSVSQSSVKEVNNILRDDKNFEFQFDIDLFF